MTRCEKCGEHEATTHVEAFYEDWRPRKIALCQLCADDVTKMQAASLRAYEARKLDSRDARKAGRE